MKSNMKFRIGLLDGLRDRQSGSKIDTDKLLRVKGPDYTKGYLQGVTSIKAINNNMSKGNEK